MVDREQIIRERFDHSGVFDFKGFYSFAHGWFVEEKFGVIEDKYSEKVTGNSRTISIEWSISKKVSDYFKIEIKIKFDIDELTDVEVEIDGTRKKMNNGKIKGDIKGILVYDYDSKWESSAMNRFFRDIYNKYVIPGRVHKMQEVIENTITGFKEEVKEFLDLTARR